MTHSVCLSVCETCFWCVYVVARASLTSVAQPCLARKGTKEKTAPFGVNAMRCQVLYRAAHLPCIKFGTAVQQLLQSSRGAPPHPALLMCCFGMLCRWQTKWHRLRARHKLPCKACRTRCSSTLQVHKVSHHMPLGRHVQLWCFPTQATIAAHCKKLHAAFDSLWPA